MQTLTEAEAMNVIAEWRERVKNSGGALEIIKGSYHDYNKACWNYTLTETASIERDLTGSPKFYKHIATLFHWKDTKWSDATKRHEPVHTYGLDAEQ